MLIESKGTDMLEVSSEDTPVDPAEYKQSTDKI